MNVEVSWWESEHAKGVLTAGSSLNLREYSSHRGATFFKSVLAIRMGTPTCKAQNPSDAEADQGMPSSSCRTTHVSATWQTCKWVVRSYVGNRGNLPCRPCAPWVRPVCPASAPPGECACLPAHLRSPSRSRRNSIPSMPTLPSHPHRLAFIQRHSAVDTDWVTQPHFCAWHSIRFEPLFS